MAARAGADFGIVVIRMRRSIRSDPAQTVFGARIVLKLYLKHPEHLSGLFVFANLLPFKIFNWNLYSIISNVRDLMYFRRIFIASQTTGCWQSDTFKAAKFIVLLPYFLSTINVHAYNTSGKFIFPVNNVGISWSRPTFLVNAAMSEPLPLAMLTLLPVDFGCLQTWTRWRRRWKLTSTRILVMIKAAVPRRGFPGENIPTS